MIKFVKCILLLLQRLLISGLINNQTFFDITRKARQELLGVDGATIISPAGRFITAGAIIDNTERRNKNTTQNRVEYGGARKKIALKLSEYGVAIKISADGYIECYKHKEHIF